VRVSDPELYDHNPIIFFRYKNVTVGNKCEIENTGYIGYGTPANGGEFVYVVSR
jgi:hypothetical protein